MSATKDFSVAGHFTEGLLKGGKGDGKTTETLAISPPRVVMGACLLSLALHALMPLTLGLSRLPIFPYRAILAAACVGGFLTGVKRCVGELVAKGSSPHHTEPTTALVTTGPYSRSRHPAYVAIQLIPTAFAVTFNSLWPLCFGIPLIVGYLHVVVIAKEEQLLSRLFPDEWKKYCASVRKWV